MGRRERAARADENELRLERAPPAGGPSAGRVPAAGSRVDRGVGATGLGCGATARTVRFGHRFRVASGRLLRCGPPAPSAFKTKLSVWLVGSVLKANLPTRQLGSREDDLLHKYWCFRCAVKEGWIDTNYPTNMCEKQLGEEPGC